MIEPFQRIYDFYLTGIKQPVIELWEHARDSLKELFCAESHQGIDPLDSSTTIDKKVKDAMYRRYSRVAEKYQ